MHLCQDYVLIQGDIIPPAWTCSGTNTESAGIRRHKTRRTGISPFFIANLILQSPAETGSSALAFFRFLDYNIYTVMKKDANNK